MPYKPSEQERFFATERIQILVESNQSYRNQTYWIVRRDVVRTPGELSAWLAFANVSDWSGRRRRWHCNPAGWREERIKEVYHLDGTARLHNRIEAIRRAQAEAIALSLPFDPECDILDWTDALRGPKTLCLVCGQQGEARGAPQICSECATALAAGRQAIAEQDRQLCALEAYDLLPHEQYAPSGRSDSLGLAKAMAALAGAVIGNATDGGREIIRLDKRGSRNWRFEIILGQAQAQAFQAAIDTIAELLNGYFAAGQRAGQSWVQDLANGRLRVDEVQDRQARGK